METFRTQVFKRAYEVQKETGKTFPVCLALCWKAYRLVKKMRTDDVVDFTFEKVNGELRHAKGTLKNIPEGTVKGEGSRLREWTPTFKAIPYYDVEKGEFRSFKMQNLIEIF